MGMYPYYGMNPYMNQGFGNPMMGFGGNQQWFKNEIAPRPVVIKKNEDAIDFNEDIGTAQQNNMLAMNAMNFISEGGNKQFDDLLETEEANNNNQNQANQDIFIDIGPYSIAWLLDEDETDHEFRLQCQMQSHFTSEEINSILYRTAPFDQLYLVKWKNLSYHDSTYEPLSTLLDFQHLIVEFEIRNKSKSLDEKRRQRKYQELQKYFIK